MHEAPVDDPTGQGRVSRADHPSKGWVSGLELFGDARSQSGIDVTPVFLHT